MWSNPMPAGIQCCKFHKMSNRQILSFQIGSFQLGHKSFSQPPSLYLLAYLSAARITVFHPASLPRRRTGWSPALASCSWRRSRSWRRRWTATWTGSAKQVKTTWPPQKILLLLWKPLPWLLLAEERRWWPQILSCTTPLAALSQTTSGQWCRTRSLFSSLWCPPRLHRLHLKGLLGWPLVCFPRLSMTPRPA